MKFIPFKEPMPNIDYEYQSQPTIRDITTKMMQEFYDELEAIVCCCMAAGVSADQIVATEPKLITDGFNAQIACQISFEGH